MIVRVDINLINAADAMKALGVDKAGRVQMFVTNEVITRMVRFMPWRTGHTATRLTRIQSPTEIVTAAPYARYLYNGVSKSGKPLNYTRTANPLAGPHWDRTMMQYEGEAIRQRTQDYIDRSSR